MIRLVGDGSWRGLLFAINSTVHWNWIQISGPLLGMDPASELRSPYFVFILSPNLSPTTLILSQIRFIYWGKNGRHSFIPTELWWRIWSILFDTHFRFMLYSFWDFVNFLISNYLDWAWHLLALRHFCKWRSSGIFPSVKMCWDEECNVAAHHIYISGHPTCPVFTINLKPITQIQ